MNMSTSFIQNEQEFSNNNLVRHVWLASYRYLHIHCIDECDEISCFGVDIKILLRWKTIEFRLEQMNE